MTQPVPGVEKPSLETVEANKDWFIAQITDLARSTQQLRREAAERRVSLNNMYFTLRHSVLPGFVLKVYPKAGEGKALFARWEQPQSRGSHKFSAADPLLVTEISFSTNSHFEEVVLRAPRDVSGGDIGEFTLDVSTSVAGLANFVITAALKEDQAAVSGIKPDH